MTSEEEIAAEDIELLRAASRRDHDAFRRLVEKYQNKVLRICYSFVRDRAEAEDLAQEVFFQVYTNAGSFRERSRVSTWMYRIAVNRSLNRLRKIRAQGWVRFLGVAGHGSDELERLESIEDNPEQLLERKQRQRRVREALERLPARQRVAFTLHKVEGVSHEEIAAILHCSVSAVEARIHRAKLNLKKHLVGLDKRRM